MVAQTAAPAESFPLAAIAPVVIVAVGFVVYCLVDLSRTEARYLPKWVWALVCVASVPLGGVLYLLVGRKHR